MPTPEEQELLASNAAFYHAFQTMDFEAMDELWARGVPVASVHPLGALVRGREAVMDAWRQILGNPDQPLVLSGDARAVMVGAFGYVTCREIAGGTPLVSTNLYVREDGGWRIAHHHSSLVVLATEA